MAWRCPRAPGNVVLKQAVRTVVADICVLSRRVFTVFSTSKDHRQGERAMAGCILVDNDKIQVLPLRFILYSRVYFGVTLPVLFCDR
jgi:hypothetical protein